MNKIIILCVLFSLFTSNLFAQNLKGRITNNHNEALFGSTVYIKESKQGVICNDDGYYQANLSAGKYNLVFTSLGYRDQIKQLNITPADTLVLNITLDENPFTLAEVVIDNNKEDAAYPIMRKAIAKAPYYDSIVTSYTAEAYIKGNLELLKVSKLIDRMAEKAEGVKASELKNQMFVQETFNQIEFTAPDKYKQTVKAFSSSFPDNFDSSDAMGILNASIYKEKIRIFISPLNPKAFSYYKFRYEGYNEENGMIVNKIKVTPKLNDPFLLEGYIYIADNTWHVNHAEFKSDFFATQENFVIYYQQIKDDVYMPISYTLYSKISLLGTVAEMNYYASMKYTDLKARAKDPETKLKPQKQKRNFEIKKDSLYVTVSDSLATKRDSLFWKEIRIMPLQDKEISSFSKRDSIQMRIDSIRKKVYQFSLGGMICGEKLGSDSSTVRFKYDGLLWVAPEYNYVDGFWLGQQLGLEIKVKDKNKLNISPYAYYTTARKRMIGGMDINLDYAPLQMGNLRVSAGSTSKDFNSVGTARFDNFISTLVYGNNYSFFYQKDFVNIENNYEITNGLSLTTGFEIAKRKGLVNNTDFNLFKSKRKITPNILGGDRFDKTGFNVSLAYTPLAYYSVSKGKKQYERFDSPTFFIGYKEGFSSWQTNNSHYRKAMAAITQTVKLSYFDRLHYHLETGTFFGSTNKTHFTDFHHFDASDLFSTAKNPFDSYLLLNSYVRSSNSHWVDARITYTSRFILLKRIPYLQNKIFTESLHFKNIYTPEMNFYTEAGYSINLSKFLSFGVYSSFDNWKYDKFALRFSCDIRKILTAF